MEKFTATMTEKSGGDPIKGAIATICCCTCGPITIAAVFLGIWAATLAIALSFENWRAESDELIGSPQILAAGEALCASDNKYAKRLCIDDIYDPDDI